MHVNGAQASKQVLAPEWTDYKEKLCYQTLDVTPMLRQGQSALGALLGDG